MQIFVPTTHRLIDAICYMERIGLMASKEMSFNNVDGRTTDGLTENGCQLIL